MRRSGFVHMLDNLSRYHACGNFIESLSARNIDRRRPEMVPCMLCPCYMHTILTTLHISTIQYYVHFLHISEPWMGLRMKPVLTSEDKKKVKKILRLNLSLVTVTNDKFFFF